VEAVAELSERGYKIALDDFEYAPEADPLLPLADYVKLDYVALGRAGFAEHVKLLEPYGVKILAEKVETREEHDFCTELGCDFFQGFFYQKPEILRERRIELNRGSMFQIISAMQDPSIQLEDLEPLIAHDVPLSLRLLRYLNSAFLGLACEVSSVRQGLILLGIDNVRRWATLTAMTSLEGKTSELTDAALLRARFCELAGVEAGLDGSEMFTVGLFSLIDAMMDTSLDEVLDNLPFPKAIRAALLHREGRMGEILTAAIALEGGSPAEAGSLVEGANSFFVQSLLWAQEAIATLSDSMALA
jgi:EAL and modified HD-GYP domain-containing signal transduction protein